MARLTAAGIGAIFPDNMALSGAMAQGRNGGVPSRANLSEIAAYFRPDPEAVFPDIAVATNARIGRLAFQADQAHSHKRSEILAATRKLLDIDPLKKLTMRKISSECNASVQTIYNLVGGKDDLFVGSTVDYCQHIAFKSLDIQPDPKRFVLTWMKMVADSAVANPTFSRNVTEEYAEKSNLFRSGLRRRLVDLLSCSLDQSCDGHRGLIYMDSRSLSERLLSLMEKSMHNWALSFGAPRSQFNIYDEFTKDALLVLG